MSTPPADPSLPLRPLTALTGGDAAPARAERPSLRAALQACLDPSRHDAWRYAALYEPAVDEPHRLSLGEGSTPLVRVPGLERALRVARVWVKREDLAPGGSHKARSLAYRVSLALQRGEPALAISSSGNAAVAASMYAAAAGLRLFAFVSPETNLAKLRWLERPGTTVIASPRPRNLARYAGRLFGIPNLTPSLDPLSIEGFTSIAAELVEALDTEVDHVFTFATSGSSLVGMGRLYPLLQGRSAPSPHGTATACAPPQGAPDAPAATPTFPEPPPAPADGLAAAAPYPGPALHAVQTGLTPTIAGPFDLRFQHASANGMWQASRLAGLLGVDDTPRADEARAWVQRSGGSGWVEHDTDILAARDLLRSCGIDTSAEGAACTSAALRARTLGQLDERSRVVIVLCGHASQWPASPQPGTHQPGPAQPGPHPSAPAQPGAYSPGQPQPSHPPPGTPATPASPAQAPTLSNLIHVEGYAELRAYLRKQLPELPRSAQGPGDDAPDDTPR